MEKGDENSYIATLSYFGANCFRTQVGNSSCLLGNGRIKVTEKWYIINLNFEIKRKKKMRIHT